MPTMRRSAFSCPRHHPKLPHLYQLYDVLVEGQLVGQMQYHPHKRKWMCIRFRDGARQYNRNKLIAHQWIQETV